MSKQTINIGASPNDGTGTPLRTSFDYTNQNFTEIYTALGGGVALPGATTQVIFNDGGTNLAGDAGLVYNKTTDALTVAGLVTAGSATITGDLTVDTNVLKVDTTNNRVGIGTATPAYLLDIADATIATRFTVTNTNNSVYGAGIYLKTLNGASTVSNATLATSNDGTFNLYTGTSADSAKLSISTAGNVSVALGNVVMATSGKGIDFSAVTGGTGTATANVLNDYEEGTWTIGFSFGGGSTGITYIQNTGKYTKVGRLVTVFGAIDLSSKGSSTGNAAITGLPFAVGGASSDYSAASLHLVNITFADFPMGFGNPTTTTIPLQEVTNAGVRTNLTDADFANNSSMIFSLTYSV